MPQIGRTRAVFVLLVLGASGASGQRANRNADDANPLGHTAEVVTAGRQLYNSSCTMCHGMEGTAGDRAPALAARRRYLRSSNSQLFDAIKNGISGSAMPAIRLPDPDIWRIVAYIRGLRAVAADEFVDGDAERGEALFNEKGGCSGCHMIRGRGGLLGPDLSNIGAERSLKAIRASLTDSATAASKGYQGIRIITAEGRAVEGVLKNEDSFSMQVMDRSYALHLLLRNELKEITYLEKSLMPRDYDRRLTKSELQDLLAYLSRQVRGRQSGRASAATLGRSR